MNLRLILGFTPRYLPIIFKNSVTNSLHTSYPFAKYENYDYIPI